MRRVLIAALLLLPGCPRPAPVPAAPMAAVDASAPTQDAAPVDAPPVDPDQVRLTTLSKRCADGDAPACFELAELVREPCTAGQITRCGYLGALELMGFAVPRNPQMAVEHFRTACDAGNGDACNALAGLHVAGWVLAEDTTLATRFARRGCELGSAEACFTWADLLRLGGDGDRATELYEQACRGAVAEGCLFAGVQHRRAGARDAALAAFDAGCKLELGTACDAARHLRGETNPPAGPAWERTPIRVQLVPEAACEYATLVEQAEDTITWGRHPEGGAYSARLASNRYVFLQGKGPSGELYLVGDSYRIERSVMKPVMWVLEAKQENGKLVGGTLRAAPGDSPCEERWRLVLMPASG